MKLPEKISNMKADKKIVSFIKEIASEYSSLNYTEVATLSKGKLKTIGEIYEVSQNLKKKRNKDAKQLGEKVTVAMAEGLVYEKAKKVTIKKKSPPKKSRLKDRKGLFEKKPSEKSLLNIQLLDSARKGDVAGLKTALDKGADIHARDEKGFTALTIAILKDDKDMIGLLKDYGAKE